MYNRYLYTYIRIYVLSTIPFYCVILFVFVFILFTYFFFCNYLILFLYAKNKIHKHTCIFKYINKTFVLFLILFLHFNDHIIEIENKCAKLGKKAGLMGEVHLFNISKY